MTWQHVAHRRGKALGGAELLDIARVDGFFGHLTPIDGDTSARPTRVDGTSSFGRRASVVLPAADVGGAVTDEAHPQCPVGADHAHLQQEVNASYHAGDGTTMAPPSYQNGRGGASLQQAKQA